MESIQTKICTKCEKVLPATLEFFYKQHNDLMSSCIECKKKNSQKDHERNKEHIQQRKREYRERNYDKVRAQERAYRERTKERAYHLSRIHNWIRYHKPKQEYCTICNEERKLELANISGNYEKNIDDYHWLCKKCHVKFDKDNNTHGRRKSNDR